MPESYVPPEEFRRYRALARGRKKLVDKRSDFKNEVNSLLDQNGVTYDGSLWSDQGREFLRELTLDDASELLLEQWLEAIDEFTVKIKRMQRRIEEVAADVDELDTLMSAPGIAVFSGLMIYGEIGEVERFDRTAEVVSYAGLDPVIRESGDSRREGQISKEGNDYLQWILVQCPNTAVHNAKDPYLSQFYWRTEQTKQAAQGSDCGNSAQAVSGVVQHAQEERTVRPTGGERLRDAGRLSLGGPAHGERLVCRVKIPPHGGCAVADSTACYGFLLSERGEQ